jgi:hypothetical protein
MLAMQPAEIQTLQPGVPSLGRLFLQFAYLQVLDLLTTVAFILSGVEEGNPLVRWIMQSAPHPFYGLLAVKLAAIALGIYCWTRGRNRLLARINVLYALLIAYNLVCLILGLGLIDHRG